MDLILIHLKPTLVEWKKPYDFKYKKNYNESSQQGEMFTRT